MNADANQKQAIIDVISLLKKSFDIRDDDAQVISQSFVSKQQEITSRLNDLQLKEQQFRKSTALELQQVRQLRNEVRQQQASLKAQYSDLDRRVEALNSQEKSVTSKIQYLKQNEEKLREKERQIAQELESIASMTREDAVNLLCEKLENDAKMKAQNKIKEVINNASATAQANATDILLYSIQKESASISSSFSTSVIELPSESLKGRIIGREGRNVKAFEEITGTTVLIDDTPETIVISCYDPIRREIAKIAMNKLILDGRIHPKRIEDLVQVATDELNDTINRAGQEAMARMQIVNIQKELITSLGKLKFRTSYSQNVLDHSIEVALIAGDIAAELNLDKKLLVRAGLLHDIGKSIDRSVAGSHAQLGADFAKQCGESDLVCKLIAEHHDNESTSVLSCIIKAADTLSSARPGARQDTFDAYVRRLQNLEAIATSFNGIKSAYAMLAGRELRVIVEPEQVSDVDAEVIAENIKAKIESEANYPGQIKITVIREKRHIKIAT